MVITFGGKHFLLLPYSYYGVLLPDDTTPSSMVFYDQIQDQVDFTLRVFLSPALLRAGEKLYLLLLYLKICPS